jgi:hypothetical protein
LHAEGFSLLYLSAWASDAREKGTEFQVEIPVKLSQELHWREPVEKTET